MFLFGRNGLSDMCRQPPGYRRHAGTKAAAGDFESMFATMRLNGLLDHSRLLTGAVGAVVL